MDNADISLLPLPLDLGWEDLDDAFLDDFFKSEEHGSECSSSPQKPPAVTPAAPDEDDKRQMRLYRNRISASQSRQRKKSLMSELEAKCKMLEARCEQLRKSVEFVNSENAALRREVSRIKCSDKCGAVEPAVLVKGSLPLEYLSYHARRCHIPAWWWDISLSLLIVLLLLLLLPVFPNRTSGVTRAAATSVGGRLLKLLPLAQGAARPWKRVSEEHQRVKEDRWPP